MLGGAIPSPIIVIHLESEEFGTEHVTVNLEWIKEDGVDYRVMTIPQVAPIPSKMSMNAQLTLSYNISYNVSVVATLCGQTSADFIELYYCESLFYYSYMYM